MKPLLIGYGEDNKPIRLTDDDFETHVHGVGASRTGKSKLIEWICREFVRNEVGFVLIDPHGHLYQDLVTWLTYFTPKREITLFNPSAKDRIVGFNPFVGGAGDVSALVGRRIKATLKAWGAENADNTPTLERTLRCLFHVVVEARSSLEITRYLLGFQHEIIRRRLTEKLPPGMIRDEWEELLVCERPKEFNQELLSAKNRLFRLIAPKQVRRVMGLTSNNLNLERILGENQTLLVNLQPSDDLDEESTRLIGTLLLNEIWEVVKRRKKTPTGAKPKPYFLIIDEFHKFLTPDVPDMLDQAAKYGLHLMLFHQHLSQLKRTDEEAFGAVMTNARTKFVFGGLQREDAKAMVEQIFPGQVDLKRVKFLIEQTKFWPVYTREQVYFSGSGGSSSSGSSSSSSETTGMAWDPVEEQWVPSASSATAWATSRGESSSWSEGVCDIPFLMPVPFKEVSSITPYSLEETLWELSDRLMEQFQRHFMLRRAGEKTVAALTPFVKPYFVRENHIASYADKLCAGYLTAEEVDDELEQIHAELRDPRRRIKEQQQKLLSQTGSARLPEDSAENDDELDEPADLWRPMLDEPSA